MKKIIILIPILFINIGLFSQKNTTDLYDRPILYNDYIIEIVNGVAEDYDNIWLEDNQAYQENKVKILAAKVKFGLNTLKQLKAFKKDKTFKDAAIKYMVFMQHIASKEMPEFLKIIFGNDINSDKNRKRLDILVRILDDDRPAVFDKLVTVQKAFAIKFKYTIEYIN